MNVFNWIAQAFVKLVTSVNNLLWGDLVVLEFSNGETQFIPSGISPYTRWYLLHRENQVFTV